jgi:hypothetical protein
VAAEPKSVTRLLLARKSPTIGSKEAKPWKESKKKGCLWKDNPDIVAKGLEPLTKRI